MARPETTPASGRSVWSLGKRIGFRFFLPYVVLYTFPFPLTPPTNPPNWVAELWQAVVPWVGAHVLHKPVRPMLPYLADTAGDHVRILVILALALLVGGVWSVVDRKRTNYERLHEWFRVYIRLILATEMIGYGVEKVLPYQFRPPTLSRLLVPFGQMSPFNLLWATMGSSRAYTAFGGWVEVLGGILLFIPRFTTLGALVCLAALSQVLALNIGFDIDAKQYSVHLLLLALFLLGPDLRRLIDLLLRNRAIVPAHERTLFRRKWLNHAFVLLQVIYGAFATTREVIQTRSGMLHLEQTTQAIPFYGIWAVDEFRLNGELRPPLVTDHLRWWRVIFDRPDVYDYDKPGIVLQLSDGLRQLFLTEFDSKMSTLALRPIDDNRGNSPEALVRGQPPLPVAGTFIAKSPGPGRLVLDGQFEGQHVVATLQKTDMKFSLLERPFRWINNGPPWVPR